MSFNEQEAKHAADVSRERDLRDLNDIHALRQADAFNRFFMRRIGEKKSKIEKSFRYDKMCCDEREILRQKLDVFEEIEKLLASDESVIQSNLSRPV